MGLASGNSRGSQLGLTGKGPNGQPWKPRKTHEIGSETEGPSRHREHILKLGNLGSGTGFSTALQGMEQRAEHSPRPRSFSHQRRDRGLHEAAGEAHSSRPRPRQQARLRQTPCHWERDSSLETCASIPRQNRVQRPNHRRVDKGALFEPLQDSEAMEIASMKRQSGPSGQSCYGRSFGLPGEESYHHG